MRSILKHGSQDYYSLSTGNTRSIEEEVKNCLLELVKIKGEDEIMKG